MFYTARIFCLALILLSVIFLGCDDDDADPAAQAVPMLTVDASYLTKNIDNWVMVHDKNGSFLGAKKFESGQVVTLETSEVVPDDLVSITLLRCDSADLAKGWYCDLVTYDATRSL